MKINGKISAYLRERREAGAHYFVLCGGRRSGKTFTICQDLLLRCYSTPLLVNVATMTSEQGRLGAYADMKTIIAGEPALQAAFEVLSSPREIRAANGSRIFFNSYQNSETAKGVACDYLFINEANNFTKQQFVDLSANVRRAIYLDFNPNARFWVDDYVQPDEICNTTWRDNPFLTPLQLDYFARLKVQGDRPDASAVDRRNYEVYYLGLYSELLGDIFSSANLQRFDNLPTGLTYYIFADPSALRGADYFASVLGGVDSEGHIYVADVMSVNAGMREDIARTLRRWCIDYGVEECFIETNGLVGVDFYEYAINSDLPAVAWYSRRNKFERIVSNYENITGSMLFARSDALDSYLEQVYTFGEKCEHDDNIDAVCSLFMALRFRGLV